MEAYYFFIFITTANHYEQPGHSSEPGTPGFFYHSFSWNWSCFIP